MGGGISILNNKITFSGVLHFLHITTFIFLVHQQASFAAGCEKDIECKGDRICVKGECVDPPPKSVPVVPSAVNHEAGDTAVSGPVQIPASSGSSVSSVSISSTDMDLTKNTREGGMPDASSADDCGGICKPSEMCYRQECRLKKDIASTANVRHAFSSALFGLGTISLLPAPIIYTVKSIQLPYGYYSFNYEDFGFDEHARNIGAGNIFEGGGIVVQTLFWAIQLPSLKAQKQMLLDLGFTPPVRKYRIAAILQGCTIGMGVLSEIFGLKAAYSIAHLPSDEDLKIDKGQLNTAGVLGYCTAGLAIATFAVNMKIYSIQKKLLSDAVYGTKKIAEPSFQIIPYGSYDNRKVNAGILALF